jgi:hypothetical protein
MQYMYTRTFSKGARNMIKEYGDVLQTVFILVTRTGDEDDDYMKQHSGYVKSKPII